MSIQASVQYGPGWRAFQSKIRRAPPELEKTLRRAAPQIARPLAKKVQAAQRASSERQVSSRMAPTTKAISVGGLPAIVSGAGVPFAMGAEYGGQRRVNRGAWPVYGKKPRARYAKRTTMQFRRHRGREGYEIWPTIRKNQSTLIDSYGRAFDRAMQRVGLI